MAELLAGKLSETEQRNQLQGIVESMHEGLIAIDKDGMIKSCNYESEKLLGLRRKPNGRQPSFTGMGSERGGTGSLKAGAAVKDKEVFYKKNNSQEKRFLCTIIPINPQNAEEYEGAPHGAMILFQNISDARERMYKMTIIDKHTTFNDIIGESESLLRAKRRTLQVSSSGLYHSDHRRERDRQGALCQSDPFREPAQK